MIRLLAMLICLTPLIAAGASTAHELRPAYLDIRETTAGDFAVVWKTPAQGEMRLGLYVRLPDNCGPIGEPVNSFEAGAFFERWTSRCPGGLRGRSLTIDGLRISLTDALLRLAHIDGSTQIARLTPEMPSLAVAASQTTFEVAQTYFLCWASNTSFSASIISLSSLR